MSRMARLLEVSRSGFYDWASPATAGRHRRSSGAPSCTAKIIDFHDASDDVYGSPRILADLREAGEQVSGKTVAA